MAKEEERTTTGVRERGEGGIREGEKDLHLQEERKKERVGETREKKCSFF